VFGCGKAVAAVVALAGENNDVFIFGVIFLFDCEVYLFTGVFHQFGRKNAFFCGESFKLLHLFCCYHLLLFWFGEVSEGLYIF